MFKIFSQKNDLDYVASNFDEFNEKIELCSCSALKKKIL